MLARTMPVEHNIYLVGPMGSGKTAVGKPLSALLGKEFFDSDAEIESVPASTSATSSRRKAKRVFGSVSAT